jgi:ribonuclease HI
MSTGAGWVVYWKGEERRRGNEGMGKSAEVYDAEMLALLRGLEAAIAFQQNTRETSRRQPTIILFADNTSAVEAITKEKPGPSQELSQKFVEMATTFLVFRFMKRSVELYKRKLSVIQEIAVY